MLDHGTGTRARGGQGRHGRGPAALGAVLPVLILALALAGCNARLPSLGADALPAPPQDGSGAAATADADAEADGNADGGSETADAGGAPPGVGSTAGVSGGAIALAPVAAPAIPFFARGGGEPEARAHAAIVVDAPSGRVLFEEDAEGLRYPASLTKMMTLYLLFDAVEAGRFNLASELPVSQEAASRPPAKLGVKAGDTITVDQAIRAMAVRSSNDVAVVVAEAVAGSEERFVDRMNRKASSLGMRRTRFSNASGLPDPDQVSTARDMAILGRALVTRHRRFAGYFSLREWTFEGRRIRATNKLLGRVDGVRGIKTGYIRLSGFNLAVHVQRGGRSLIVVVFGGRTGAARDAKVEELIEAWMPKASRRASPILVRN